MNDDGARLYGSSKIVLGFSLKESSILARYSRCFLQTKYLTVLLSVRSFLLRFSGLLARNVLSAGYFFRKKCLTSASIQLGSELVSLIILVGTNLFILLKNSSFHTLTISSPGFFGSSQPGGSTKCPPIITFLLLGE